MFAADPKRWMRVTAPVAAMARNTHAGRVAAFEAHLFDQMRDDHPVNDLQYRREQFGMHGKEAAQRDRERQHPRVLLPAERQPARMLSLRCVRHVFEFRSLSHASPTNS